MRYAAILMLFLTTSVYAHDCRCGKVCVEKSTCKKFCKCPYDYPQPKLCRGIPPKPTSEQIIRREKLLRDERKDIWVQDLYQPGRWWYGYYDSKGSFVARFTRLTPMSNFSSLYPMNYQLYLRNQPRAVVDYKGR